MAGEDKGKKAASGYHEGRSRPSFRSRMSTARRRRWPRRAFPSSGSPRWPNNDPYVTIENLRAGYGKMEILHDFNLQVAKGQSLCLIGPNGAGKSTVLHSIFGFTRIFAAASRSAQGRRSWTLPR